MVSVWHQSTAKAIQKHRIRLLSYRSRGTVMSYTDHSAQRRLKSNAPNITYCTFKCHDVWSCDMQEPMRFDLSWLEFFWSTSCYSWVHFWSLIVLNHIDFHNMDISIWNILQNIFFCVPQKKKVKQVLNDMWVSKWRQNFHFWWALHLKYQYAL